MALDGIPSGQRPTNWQNHQENHGSNWYAIHDPLARHYPTCWNELYWTLAPPRMSRRQATKIFYGPKGLYSYDGIGRGGDYRHPGVLTVPQSPSSVLNTNNPLNKSGSHRTVVLPRLQYVDTNQDQHGYNTEFGNSQANTRSMNLHNSSQTAVEHASPSDALRNLYRLAERVYHVDGRQNGHHFPTSSPPPAPPKGRDGAEIGHALDGSYRHQDYSSHTHHSTHHKFSSASSTVSDLSDSRSSLYTLGASTLVGDNDLGSSIHSANGHGWQKGQIDEIKAMLRNIASSVTHSSVKGNDDSYHGSLLRLEKANSTLEKTNSELVKTNSKLQHENEQSHTKLEQTIAKWQKEQHSHEQADAQIKVLQAELKHANTRLQFVEGLLEEGKRREEALQHRYDALSTSIQDLRTLLSSQAQSHSQVHVQAQHQPAWVKDIRRDIREDLTGLETGLRTAIAESHQCTVASKEEVLNAIGLEKTSIVGPIASDLKRQRDEIAQLTERTSRVVAAQDHLLDTVTKNHEQFISHSSSSKEHHEQLSSTRELSSKTYTIMETLSTEHKENKLHLDQITHSLNSVSSNVLQVKTEVENVRSQVDSTTAQILGSVESRMNSVDKISTKVDSGISHIDTAIQDSQRAVNTTLTGLAAKLDSHTVHSKESLTDLQAVFNERTSMSLNNYSQVATSISETNVQLQALSDKVQQFIHSSAERDQVYANVAAKSKRGSDDDNDEDGATHSPVTAIAIESLRSTFTTSFSGIREAVDKQQVNIQKLLTQTATHSDRQELMVSQADNTIKRLEGLDASIRQAASDNASSHAHALAKLEKIDKEIGQGLETVNQRLDEVNNSLENVSNGTWVEDAINGCNLSKREDISDVIRAIDDVSSRLDQLESSQSSASASSLAEVSTQLDSISSRLADIEVGVQGAATTAEITEEISTIKVAHSNEHQANITATTRVQSTVESLEEYTKTALDQVNAALDEQQSRLVAIQSHCRQHSEDSKSLSATLAVNTDMLRQVNSATQSSPGIESLALTQDKVVASLEDIKITLASIKESDISRIEVLRNVSSRSDESFSGIRLALKEQQSLLQSLSERFSSESSEHEEIISTKIAEIVTLLTSVISTVEISSKETTILKEMISKVDADLSTNNSTDATISSATLSNISQAIDTLSQNVASLQAELGSTLKSQPAPAYTPLEAMISELRTKLDSLLTEVNGTKSSLTEDISTLRQESSSKTESFDRRIVGLVELLSTSTVKSNEQISGLRSLLESRTEEYTELKNSLSQSHASSTSTISAQLQNINVALQSLTLNDIQASLNDLSVTVKMVQGLVAEENGNAKVSSSTLTEIQAALQSLSEKLAQVMQSQSSNDGRHETVVALLDRNYQRCTEVQDTLVSQHTSAREAASTVHASSLAALEDMVASFRAYSSSNDEKYQSIQKTLISLQTIVDQRSQTDSTQATEVTSKVTEVSQTLVELRQLLQSQFTSSESIQTSMSKWESSHSSLTAIVQQQYSEIIAVLNRSIESLRSDVTKEPAQLNALLVGIQENITSLQQNITVTQQSWQQSLQQSLQSQFAVLHQEMTNTSSRDQSFVEDIKHHQQQTEVLSGYLQRMEKLQIALETIIAHHHCEGCNCKGYDSEQASPLYRRRGLSRVGSDATGTSPRPYMEQSFDVPSPSALKKEFSGTETQAKPYSVEFLGSYEEHSEHAADKDKPESISFPPTQGNRRGSVGSGRHVTIHQSSSTEHHHHHKHHDDREISNPFELFASLRSRKSSHKTENSEDAQAAESSDRPRVKSNNASSVRTSTSIGSGKGQRMSVLGSALLSTVSDSAVPQARKRTTSGGLNRLSSIFGKHHHHHEVSIDETGSKHSLVGKPKELPPHNEEGKKDSE